MTSGAAIQVRRNEQDLEDAIFRTLWRVGICLNISVARNHLELGDVSLDLPVDDETEIVLLMAGAKQAGIQLKEIDAPSSTEIFRLVSERYPIVAISEDDAFLVFESQSGRHLEVSIIDSGMTTKMRSRQQVANLAHRHAQSHWFVCKPELECDSLSSSPAGRRIGHGDSKHDDQHQDRPTPLRRFIGMLSLDRRDIGLVILFAFVSGILALATPLAIESLVNVVSWGTYIQPLVVLALMLLACLGIAGVLSVLQTVVVEMIQRRQLVRIVGDLAHRFPRANQGSLAGTYPRELANRIFDIMTIQKATAVLLLDGVSIVLTTIVGLVLLAFYHPFLLGFDIVLVLSMISVTWVLGRGGIRTAVDESIMKYKITHWLQDVLASPSAFKINGGETLAIERSNQLVTEYIESREQQFRVVIRQVTFAIGLQVAASTAVLGLGGWLVIDGQLTLGQLVASELVVTVVVGAFAKAGKSLEKFYDLMAGMDKVGHLLDVPVDPRHQIDSIPDAPAEVTWDDLLFSYSSGKIRIPATTLASGSRVAVVGDHAEGRDLLARAMSGLAETDSGVIQVAGFDAEQAAMASHGRMIAYAGEREVFHGTLQDNVDLGRSGIGQQGVRESLTMVGLASEVLNLPDGLQTTLQSNGHPLSKHKTAQLMIARAIAGKPKLLIINHLLDELTPLCRNEVWEALSHRDAPWTLVVMTNLEEIAERCDTQVSVRF